MLAGSEIRAHADLRRYDGLSPKIGEEDSGPATVSAFDLSRYSTQLIGYLSLGYRSPEDLGACWAAMKTINGCFRNNSHSFYKTVLPSFADHLNSPQVLESFGIPLAQLAARVTGSLSEWASLAEPVRRAGPSELLGIAEALSPRKPETPYKKWLNEAGLRSPSGGTLSLSNVAIARDLAGHFGLEWVSDFAATAGIYCLVHSLPAHLDFIEEVGAKELLEWNRQIGKRGCSQFWFHAVPAFKQRVLLHRADPREELEAFLAANGHLKLACSESCLYSVWEHLVKPFSSLLTLHGLRPLADIVSKVDSCHLMDVLWVLETTFASMIDTPEALDAFGINLKAIVAAGGHEVVSTFDGLLVLIRRFGLSPFAEVSQAVGPNTAALFRGIPSLADRMPTQRDFKSHLEVLIPLAQTKDRLIPTLLTHGIPAIARLPESDGAGVDGLRRTDVWLEALRQVRFPEPHWVDDEYGGGLVDPYKHEREDVREAIDWLESRRHQAELLVTTRTRLT